LELKPNQIICGDCIEILSGIDEPIADLIFADPPFNIGYKYDKYHDTVESKNYIAWTKDWMLACCKALKPAGSFYIAIGDDYAANVKIIADEIGLTMRNWIIWHYTFGQQTKAKFARAHTHIFYFVKDKDNYTFNDRAVRVPSDRQLVYNDKRSNPEGKMPDDVWDTFSRVCGTFKERQGWHPCQMPEILLARIIAASSKAGDVVLDPFSGSGTTAASAYQYGRKYIGIDMSNDYCEKTRERLEELEKLEWEENFKRLEIKRLCIEMGFSPEQILANDKIFYFYKSQLDLRLDGILKILQKEITDILNSFGKFEVCQNKNITGDEPSNLIFN
jgi:site-specific DNA-methyltransferase (adenine-specific)